VLVVNEDIRELVMRRASEAEIEQAARNNGMTTIMEDGTRKCRAFVTSVEEVLRVTVRFR
jgi:type II secretory ATPase GspE/PulE/Tfp pilus assembly ATPase PilB-like protein